MLPKVDVVTIILLISVTSVSCPAPELWLEPFINSKDGSGVLAETLREDHSSNSSSFFSRLHINNVPTFYHVVQQKYDGMFFVDFVSPYGLLHINDTTTLDYEQDQSLIIQVRGGNPAGTGTATLTINVEDVNDNIPIFEYPMYRESVSSLDGITEGSYVTTLTATDQDSGVNQDLSYAITFGDGTSTLSASRFNINSKTGNITTTGYAFEKFIYVLRITATDNGSVPLTGTTTLSVCINGVYCGKAQSNYSVDCMLMSACFVLFHLVLQYETRV